MRKKSEMQKANEEFVKTYDDSKYPKPSVTADIVIFGMFDKEEDNYRKTNELITRFMENDPAFKSDYEVAYIQHGKDVEYGIYNRYDNAVVLLDKCPQKLSYHIFPEGEYLTAYHAGNWKNIGTAYQRMIAYIKEHNLLVENDLSLIHISEPTRH